MENQIKKKMEIQFKPFRASGFMRISENWGYLFGGLNNKDYSILGSI